MKRKRKSSDYSGAGLLAGAAAGVLTVIAAACLGYGWAGTLALGPLMGIGLCVGMCINRK